MKLYKHKDVNLTLSEIMTAIDQKSVHRGYTYDIDDINQIICVRHSNCMSKDMAEYELLFEL